MYKVLSNLFLFIALLTIIITYTLKESNFEHYFIVYSDFQIKPNIIRVLTLFYYLALSVLSYKYYQKGFYMSKSRAIWTFITLCLPLTFYILTNQNIMISGAIWETVFPFYNHPQSYITIFYHYSVVIIVLFIINLISLLIYIFIINKMENIGDNSENTIAN